MNIVVIKLSSLPRKNGSAIVDLCGENNEVIGTVIDTHADLVIKAVNEHQWLNDERNKLMTERDLLRAALNKIKVGSSPSSFGVHNKLENAEGLVAALYDIAVMALGREQWLEVSKQ